MPLLSFHIFLGFLWTGRIFVVQALRRHCSFATPPPFSLLLSDALVQVAAEERLQLLQSGLKPLWSESRLERNRHTHKHTHTRTNKSLNLRLLAKVEKPPGLSNLSAGEKVSIKQVEYRRRTRSGRLRVLVDPHGSLSY